MTDRSPFDALLPPQMARQAEEVGVTKAAMDAPSLFWLAVLAGAFVALGGVFATTALAGAAAAPWGMARVVAGVVFSLGLILVVVGGAELFTGNNLVVMAWASGRIETSKLARSWLIVYAGNFVGAVLTALAVYLGGVHEFGQGAFGVVAVELAAAKLRLGWGQAVVLGVLCNALVCLAVWLALSARTTADRVLAVVPPISAFVAAGFEHSVANMYFVPFALFVRAFDPGFVSAAALDGQAQVLVWDGFLFRNLLPVTIGNMLGGTVLVGLVYWFVYLRPRARMRAVARSAPSRGPLDSEETRP